MSASDTTGKSRGQSPRSSVTRRRVIRSGVTIAATASGTAAALRHILTAHRTTADGAPGDRGTAAGGAAPALFDEVYRGRRIQGFPDRGEEGVAITVDGVPLQVMRRVDGSWISVANHYQPYTTPLATARGAVDVLGRAALSTAVEHHH